MISDPQLETIAQAMRGARERIGWSQEELSERSGMSLNCVKKVESARRVKSATFLTIVSALKQGLATTHPSLPSLEISYPQKPVRGRGQIQSATETHLAPAMLPPYLSAVRSALRHVADATEKSEIRLGQIRSPAELRKLWAIDNVAYGSANITFEHFQSLWRAFPAGLKVLFDGNEIIGALGIWPVTPDWAERLKNTELKEAQLDSAMVKQAGQIRARQWYITGIVLRQELIGSHGIRILLGKGLRSWVECSRIDYPCEILALAYSAEGEALLRRFSFYCVQEKETMPDQCALYQLDLEVRDDTETFLRRRGLHEV
jgi:transcriptional regulator with XRE-family HTH domain